MKLEAIQKFGELRAEIKMRLFLISTAKTKEEFKERRSGALDALQAARKYIENLKFEETRK